MNSHNEMERPEETVKPSTRSLIVNGVKYTMQQANVTFERMSTFDRGQMEKYANKIANLIDKYKR